MIQLLDAIQRLAQSAGQIRNLTWVQWLVMLGAVAGTFGSAYQAGNHDPTIATTAAMAAAAVYLHGLAATPPFTKRAANQEQSR
jgi:hypothetical protein